jgi:hypothetical protein
VFQACYNQKAKEKLAVSAQTASPAQILPLRLGMAPSDGYLSSRVTSVPIQAVHNRYLVPVLLNERQTTTFLLDTGANIAVGHPGPGAPRRGGGALSRVEVNDPDQDRQLQRRGYEFGRAPRRSLASPWMASSGRISSAASR